MVDRIAKKGANEEGRKELVSAVYCTKLFHPDDRVPQRFSLLATADKKPVANAILNKKTAMSCLVFIPVIFVFNYRDKVQ